MILSQPLDHNQLGDQPITHVQKVLGVALYLLLVPFILLFAVLYSIRAIYRLSLYAWRSTRKDARVQ